MPKATLTISVPEELWIARVSREHSVEELRVLSAIPSGATGVAVAELVAEEPASIVETIREMDVVADVELLEGEDDRALLQLETTKPMLLNAARSSGVPVRMPFTIRDGEATWEVTASRDRLSELGDQLEAFGVRYSVDSICQRVDSEQFLTDHQWEVLRTAIARGYYDTPRTCTQYELADALGVAKSTCSETLHRAEERVVKEFADAVSEPAQPTMAP